jgi:hypothetical protein
MQLRAASGAAACAEIGRNERDDFTRFAQTNPPESPCT